MVGGAVPTAMSEYAYSIYLSSPTVRPLRLGQYDKRPKHNAAWKSQRKRELASKDELAGCQNIHG